MSHQLWLTSTENAEQRLPGRIAEAARHGRVWAAIRPGAMPTLTLNPTLLGGQTITPDLRAVETHLRKLAAETPNPARGPLTLFVMFLPLAPLADLIDPVRSRGVRMVMATENLDDVPKEIQRNADVKFPP